MLLAVEQIPRQDYKGEADERTKHRSRQPVGGTFVDQTEARREHKSARHGVQCTEPFAGKVPDEKKGSAPSPVASAVRSARRKTCTTPETFTGFYPIA